MTRQEAETAILQKAKEIMSILNEFCPEDDYFNLCLRRNYNGEDLIVFNNSYYGKENRTNEHRLYYPEY